MKTPYLWSTSVLGGGERSATHLVSVTTAEADILVCPFGRRLVGSQRWSGHGDGREKVSNSDYSALNGTVSLDVLSLFLTIFLLDL
jgi:hypothetical protein